ncbi:MAG: outer membrane protein assembly factor BamB [Burkholderiales bacterium]|nr:outer membrane protein assembly factor BamB [Burkholderiales bacterium]
MRIAHKLGLLSIAVVLAGCSALSAINPFASKAPPRNPPAELTELKPTMAVRTVWSASVGSAGTSVFSPAAVGDSVFAAAADGTVVRVEINGGRTVWRANAGMALTGGVGAGGNTVVVAGEKGAIVAFDMNGKERWKAQASSEVLSAPAVGGGFVVVRGLDNRITAFDAESGTRRWSVQRNAPALTLRSAPGIAISGMNAYVAMPGGRLLAVALNNGGVRWEGIVGEPRGATELERIADISGMPLMLGREICSVAYQGRVACFDAINGAVRWAKELSSDVGLGGDERFVFSVDERSAVSAFSRESGASVWRNTKLANRRLSTPLSFGRAVAVGDYQGYIHFLSREDGSLLARVTIDGSQVVGTPLVAGPHAIFQTQAGMLTALGTD